VSDKPLATNLANELARERNREAAERTLMAWIRTALSLIGFGFGIGKLDAYLQGAGLHTLTTPLIYQTGPKTSAKSGWSCSMREKHCISGRSLASGIMGIRS